LAQIGLKHTLSLTLSSKLILLRDGGICSIGKHYTIKAGRRKKIFDLFFVCGAPVVYRQGAAGRKKSLNFADTLFDITV
jgi:hypothetical protein